MFENLIVSVQKGRIMVSYICCVEERTVKMPQYNVVFAETAPFVDQLTSQKLSIQSYIIKVVLAFLFTAVQCTQPTRACEHPTILQIQIIYNLYPPSQYDTIRFIYY
jgi:hypothetical protein